MKFLRHKTIRLAVTILLSALFLYVALQSLKWDELLTSIKTYNFWWLLPVTFLVLFSIFLRALRWQLILKPTKKVKTHILFEAIILSYFTNILLPVNIGEIIRAYLLKKKVKIKMFSVFGSIAVERVISIFGFLFVGIFAALLITLPPELLGINRQILNSLKYSTALFLVLLFIILLIKRYRQSISQFIYKFSNKISKTYSASFQQFYINFLKGLRFGINKTDLFFIVLYSVLIRIIYGILTLSIARGFGVELPLLTFLFIDVLVSFAHSIGAHLFGIIGAYEVTLTYALSFFGVAKEIGLSVALLADATFIIPSVVLGFIYFVREGLSFKIVQSLKKTQ